MPSTKTQRVSSRGKLSRSVTAMERWKLEDAKARLSEVVRLAASEGPQLVTIRGKEAAVILAPDQYMEMLPRAARQPSLVPFLQKLGLDQVEMEREIDRGREIDL